MVGALLEFPPGTGWIQLRGKAVAVTPDDRVYLVANGRAIELIAAADDDAVPPEGVMRMQVGELTGDDE